MVANVRLRGQKKRCLAVLHKHGNVSFWSQDDFSFITAIKLNQPSQKIVFESSNRFMASLTASASLEVWKLPSLKHWWDLAFVSITDVFNNPHKENQFFLTMNADD